MVWSVNIPIVCGDYYNLNIPAKAYLTLFFVPISSKWMWRLLCCCCCCFIVILHISFTCVHLQGAKDEQQASISKLKRRFLKDRQSSSAFYARLQVKKKQNREVCSVIVSSRVCSVT